MSSAFLPLYINYVGGSGGILVPEEKGPRFRKVTGRFFGMFPEVRFTCVQYMCTMRRNITISWGYISRLGARLNWGGWIHLKGLNFLEVTRKVSGSVLLLFSVSGRPPPICTGFDNIFATVSHGHVHQTTHDHVHTPTVPKPWSRKVTGRFFGRFPEVGGHKNQPSTS